MFSYRGLHCHRQEAMKGEKVHGCFNSPKTSFHLHNVNFSPVEGNEAKYKAGFFTGIKTSTPRFKSNRFWIVVQPVPNVSGVQFISIYYSKYTSSRKQKKTRKLLGFSRCALETKTLQKQSTRTLKDSRSLGLIWQQTDS